MSFSSISIGLTAMPMGHFAVKVHVYILRVLNQELYKWERRRKEYKIKKHTNIDKIRP